MENFIMDRIIFHSDINSCYASIEHLYHPELRDLPLAVAGSEEARHGIILAKDEKAKRAGVKTGMAIWQAKQLCPELVTLPPRLNFYVRFSNRVQKIYADYTDMRESFGIDESWLDLTGCINPSEALDVANEINRRVKDELGVTVSIGVSWNKIFAKLGSDYKKPDAVTQISRENYQSIVWPLPVEDLLYVGRATTAKLRSIGISTIGDLALADPELLHRIMGKMGYAIHAFANGLDSSPVRRTDLSAPIKSVGNSTTCPRDLVCDEDVRITLLALSESVGMRLREGGFKGRVLSVSVRGTDLSWRSHQIKLAMPTDITMEIFRGGMALFSQLHTWPLPIRSLGISVSDLSSADAPEQTDIFGDCSKRHNHRELDLAIDSLRGRFGFDIIRRGLASSDLALGGVNAKDDHIVHPIGFFGGH